ncbi:class I SAM-dependent RNA methyltransferase [Marmoricola sp. RAF53]|uniref:class I SAM-dependent RNA methyltransferase n=1 Tax=Marmoricola sp. RAF53 TaxID=3233059 RepID=UPI003F9C7951
MSRQRTSFAVGDRVEAVMGPIAHGGHVVARVADPEAPADARPVVVFVRHALPGERVVVEITELDKTFLRGDAVEVLEPSPDRVPAPCPVAHPDGCGGCDFQHVALPAQRALKAAVVAEQLQRLAGLTTDVVVEAVPGAVSDPGQDGLRWRTRMQYVPAPGGGRGLRKHRSHEVVPVEDCLIAAPGAREVLDRAPSEDTVTERVRGRAFEVAADGFWQVHPGAPEALVAAVLEALSPRRGDRVLDLYAGVGLFSAFLAEAVDVVGHVTSVEGDRRATELAAGNLADLHQVDVRHGRVDRVLATHEGRVDLVVLDPPREGAKRPVVDAIAGFGPRSVAYVACDPAALARDVATFAGHGYRLAGLRAFDLFPMTHHVECVALLTRD